MRPGVGRALENRTLLTAPETSERNLTPSSTALASLVSSVAGFAAAGKIVRAGVVKLPALVAVPPSVVTVIGPVVAPDGTVAVIWVSEFTVNVEDTLLKLTDVAPVKLFPVIVTTVPADPPAGVNEVITGPGGGRNTTSTQ